MHNQRDKYRTTHDEPQRFIGVVQVMRNDGSPEVMETPQTYSTRESAAIAAMAVARGFLGLHPDRTIYAVGTMQSVGIDYKENE